MTTINKAFLLSKNIDSLIINKELTYIAINIFENSNDFYSAFSYHLEYENLKNSFENLMMESKIKILKYEKESELINLQTHYEMTKATKLKSISIMSNAFSYELDANLNNIKIDAESILYWDKKNNQYLPGIIIEEIKMINESVDRTKLLMEQMKNFWEFNGEFDLEEININRIIVNVSALLKNDLKKTNILINLDLHESQLCIKANKIYLEQILINLINNSINAFEKSLNSPKCIFITTRINLKNLSHPFVKIIFSDNATGIPDLDESKIYNEFKLNYNNNCKGMGIGLSLVKKFLDRFSGTIKAYNNEIGGVCFEIDFPLYLLK